jgi:hypothetical protein
MQLLFDFQDPAAVVGWEAVDDRVMGGISQSRFSHDPGGFAVFAGTVSLQRNGGFASVRAPLAGPCAAHAQHCQIEVHSSDKSAKLYKLNLITSPQFDGINYQAEFSPGPGLSPAAWQTISLPIASFSARFRGRAVSHAERLESARICQVGLMISGGQAGDFALAIRRIWLD